MNIDEPWICPTCDSNVSTPYCPSCGERPLNPGDLTLGGLAVQIVQSLSDIDGRLLNSFRCLIMRPGALTSAYLQGQRQPYIGPLPLFLYANVIFFALQSLTDFRIFSTLLDMHLHDQMWHNLAQFLVTQRLKVTGMTLELYTPLFNQAVALNAKSLIGLMILPFALILPLVFRRIARPFAVHVVFSLHFYAFMLLLLCVPMGVKMISGATGMFSPGMDHAVSILLLLACAAYLYAAAGKVYETNKWIRVIHTIALSVALMCIFLGYRFILFLITLYST